MLKNKPIAWVIDNQFLLSLCLSICATGLSCIIQLFDHPTLSRWAQMGALALFAYGSIYANVLKKTTGTNTVGSSAAWQLFWISFVFTVLWDSSLLSSRTEKSHSMVICIGAISLNASTVMWLAYIAKENVFKQIAGFVRSNRYLLVLMGIFFILSFSAVFNWPRIDSNDYYRSILKAVSWDFTFDSLDEWRLCSHDSFGYTIFAVIGEYLWPGDGKGVRLMQVVLVCISIGAFSGIIRKLGVDRNSRSENALITAMFAFTPLILGTISEISLELPMACFFLWFLYSYLNKKRIFEVASVFLLLFTKEPAITLLFGFGLGWLFVNVLQTIRQKNSTAFYKRKAFWQQLAIFVIPALFYAAVFALMDPWTSMANTSVTDVHLEGDRFGFGINLDNIATKNKEFFAMNFAWLMLAVIAIANLHRKIRRRPKAISAADEDKRFWVYLLAAVVCFYIFNIIYISYCNPRYLTAYFAVLPIFVAGAIRFCSKKTRIQIYAIIAGLLLAQSFATIDPVMLSAFKNIDTGNGRIVATRTFMQNRDGTLSTDDEAKSNNEMSSGASYNRQYSYISDLMEKTLSEIEYDEETLIILAPTYGRSMTRMTFLGNRIEDAPYYFNQNAEKLTFDPKGTLIHYTIPTKPTDDISFEGYDRAFILYFPYREQYYNADPLLEQYEILDDFAIEHNGWVVDVYQVK